MRRRLFAVAGGGVLLALLLPAAPASAHPLGNFSINQYVGVTIGPDRITAKAIVDSAEIPTLQQRSIVDADGDGTASVAEQARHAARVCGDVSRELRATFGGAPVTWTVTASSFGYTTPTGGLAVSKATCQLSAPVTLGGGAQLRIANDYLADRVGWREITATGHGVALTASSVPTSSVSGELSAYPADLLTSTLDVRSATVLVASAGSGPDSAAAGPGGAAPAGGVGPAGGAGLAGGDPVSRWMAMLDRRFSELAGGASLTPWVGLLAVALALVLGAGHAALPGHGKTILAAYLAGRQGRPRDAWAVAGTVTLTHTGGVLLLGLALTAGAAVAGEQIISWLGLVSGLVVLVVGVSMLAGLVRQRRTPAGHSHGFGGHSHGPGGHSLGRRRPAQEPSRQSHGVDEHSHGPGWHSHESGGHAPGSGAESHGPGGHTHGPGGHTHGFGHANPHGHAHDDDAHAGHDHGGHGNAGADVAAGEQRPAHRSGRWGLAGIGIAGGLVPSPSALVVLLAAIGLGRTGFGVVLVLAYGAGMALMLAGAGLALLAIQRRLATRTGAVGPSWLSTLAARVTAATPAATATLVLIVGAGLALRAGTAVL